MNFVRLSILFALAVTLHNLEEAVLLPAWSQSAGLWHPPIGAPEFRFTVTILTLLAYAAVYFAVTRGRESLGAYLLSGYALAMLLNAFFPHVIATAVMRRYAPGTLTAVLLNLPVTFLLLRQGFKEQYIHARRFIRIAPLVILGLLASIPALFFIGRILFGTG
jgi:hypothetical protein